MEYIMDRPPRSPHHLYREQQQPTTLEDLWKALQEARKNLCEDRNDKKVYLIYKLLFLPYFHCGGLHSHAGSVLLSFVVRCLQLLFVQE